jgi:hypothetical protein
VVACRYSMLQWSCGSHSSQYCITRTVPCSEIRGKKKWINYYPDGWQYLKFVASFRNISFHPERNLHSSRRLFADFSRLNRLFLKAKSPVSHLTQRIPLLPQYDLSLCFTLQ